MSVRDRLFEIVDREVRRPSVAQIGGFRPEPGLRSWFGGSFWLPPELPWPSSDGKPMIPLLQVVASELPVVPAELKGAEVVQVFVGDDLPWDTPTFGGPGFAVLSHIAAGLEPREAPFEYAYPRPFQVRWSLGPREGPTWTDTHSLLPLDLVTEYVEEEDCFTAFSDRYFPFPSTKVGGWPCYIQDAPVVEGTFVLQIASEEKPRWMFGDNGTLYFYHRRGEWGVHVDCY